MATENLSLSITASLARIYNKGPTPTGTTVSFGGDPAFVPQTSTAPRAVMLLRLAVVDNLVELVGSKGNIPLAKMTKDDIADVSTVKELPKDTHNFLVNFTANEWPSAGKHALLLILTRHALGTGPGNMWLKLEFKTLLAKLNRSDEELFEMTGFAQKALDALRDLLDTNLNLAALNARLIHG